jgi:hypothetical protein
MDDHEIIVGLVRHVATNGEGAPPPVFWRGGYASIARPVMAP